MCHKKVKKRESHGITMKANHVLTTNARAFLGTRQQSSVDWFVLVGINEKKARIISSVPKRYARKTGKPLALNRRTKNEMPTTSHVPIKTELLEETKPYRYIVLVV